jgi:hypothetical protein
VKGVKPVKGKLVTDAEANAVLERHRDALLAHCVHAIGNGIGGPGPDRADILVLVDDRKGIPRGAWSLDGVRLRFRFTEIPTAQPAP